MVPRPAVVVTPEPIGPEGLLIWTVMVTNAQRPAWPGDVLIPEAESLGLLIPSKVRTTKIGAVEAGAATLIGRLPDRVWGEIDRLLRTYLGY
jgi:mRNA-degrading endonuclease toxin of MazEF toxin-antitoxin module